MLNSALHDDEWSRPITHIHRGKKTIDPIKSPKFFGWLNKFVIDATKKFGQFQFDQIRNLSVHVQARISLDQSFSSRDVYAQIRISIIEQEFQ